MKKIDKEEDLYHCNRLPNPRNRRDITISNGSLCDNREVESIKEGEFIREMLLPHNIIDKGKCKDKTKIEIKMQHLYIVPGKKGE